MSFNQALIPLETHKEWFAKVLSLRSTRLFIVEGQESEIWLPIAQVRVDEDGEISMSLAKEFRGRHLATPVIKTAIAHIKRVTPIRKLVAHIKPENIRSVKAFSRAGFHFARETTVKGHPCLEYTLEIKGSKGLPINDPLSRAFSRFPDGCKVA
jgi:hypothetical protein